MTDRWLTRTQTRLRWRDEGSGLPVLLLHGWALDLKVFDPVVARLRGLRVLRFDRRGFGLSDGVPSLAADVEDALALLDAAGVARCVVLGQSQGARVAARLARQAPARVAAIVLDGAPALEGLASGDPEPEIPLEDWRELRRREGLDALRDALAAHPLLRLAADQPTAEARRLRAALLARYPALDLLAPSEPAAGRDAGAFSQPVLVLNGERDSVQRLRAGREIGAALPHATSCLLAGAGHLACLDDPQSYAAAVHAFATAHHARL